MKASSSAALDCCAQSRRFVLFVFHGAITITTSARETYATPRPALNTPVHSMVALYTVNTLAASTRLPRRYIDYPSFANARLSYNWRRTERSAHAQHAPDSACPLEERKQRTRHHRVTTVSSTGKVRHVLTSLRAPRVARTPQTQPGSRRAEAGSGAKQRRLAPRSARHSDARFGSPRSALRASLGRLKRSRAGSGAKQRRLAPRSARRSDARFGSPRSALRASLGRPKRSRAGSGRKLAAVPSNGASLRAPRVARTLASAHLAPRSARRSDASNAAGQSASESLRRHRPPARLRRPRVQTQPGRGRSRRSRRRAHTRARAAALVSSCVGATRRRSRARPLAAPTLGRGHPNSSFGVRERRRGWASALRAGERLTGLTSPPLDQIVRVRAPPRALPASHFAECWRMAAKAPRGAMEIL